MVTSNRSTFKGLRRVAAGLVFIAAAGWGITGFAQWRGPVGGPGHGMGMMMASRPEHAARMVDHLLDGIDATEAQRSQVRQIVLAAAVDLKAQAAAAQELHQKGVELFKAPSVDSAAVEALRQQAMSQHDASSRRFTQAMLDISKVLSPEQRVKLIDRMKSRHGGRMQGHGPGHHPEPPQK